MTLVQLGLATDAAGKLWPAGLSILLKTEGLLVQQALALAQEQAQ